MLEIQKKIDCRLYWRIEACVKFVNLIVGEFFFPGMYFLSGLIKPDFTVKIANFIAIFPNFSYLFFNRLGYCRCCQDYQYNTNPLVISETIPDAVKTKCLKCNPKQKELIRVVVRALQEKLPELWDELVKKEDPNGHYKADFDAFLKD